MTAIADMVNRKCTNLRTPRWNASYLRWGFPPNQALAICSTKFLSLPVAVIVDIYAKNASYKDIKSKLTG
mgnify:FL=1